jgi:hypothetical protein
LGEGRFFHEDFRLECPKKGFVYGLVQELVTELPELFVELTERAFNLFYALRQGRLFGFFLFINRAQELFAFLG